MMKQTKKEINKKILEVMNDDDKHFKSAKFPVFSQTGFFFSFLIFKMGIFFNSVSKTGK